ncbi:3-dehydroshikimate dehydratase [Phlyctema vagabunda]|uniref:3-dehydroshikimate dehydratase n=1 Tax=Phlyctema vagabunda TaxID=108571 RepID=A0ABR4P4C7_9HELO
MSISRASLDTIPTSYASVSLGTPDDSLEDKLKAISSAGFQAIELGFPDLISFASSHHEKEIKEDDYSSLCSAGVEVKKLCEKYKIEIMMLQPFSNFEGWEEGSKEREEAFSRAKGWIQIMQAVGTDMLQVGSSDSPNITSSLEALASDLRDLAEMLAKHNFRLAYENWCWATHAPKWKDVWNIVEQVDRPNVGLCLDTFQTAGSEWADPTTDSGKIESVSLKTLEDQFNVSLQDLSRTIPPSKIYLLQISDGYKPPNPFSKDLDESGLRPRGRWSHDFRPYPYNGGYLPVKEVATAVLKTGFRGWFSMEVFDGGSDGKGGMKQYNFDEFAKGAMESHRKLLDDCADGP